MPSWQKPELLAPAGDIERLIAAVNFGADAVYLAGKEFGMRASQTNFDNETLKKGVDYAHAHNARVYLTVNTLPRNDEIDKLPDYLRQASEIGVDAIIASDIGVLALVKEVIPDMEIHVSTQSGVVNYKTCLELHKMGAKRIVLARELSLDEIAEIRSRIPDEVEIECFVHGAMCMSFSGRCLISNYLTARDANRGECAQPCRWKYSLVEEKRPGEYFPVVEDDKGSYILNAKDMCLLEHLDKLYKAGITSFKIEGRAKSSYYVSAVTNAYRIAMDMMLSDPDNFILPRWLMDEVEKVSHRRYSTGFYFNTPDQYYETGGYIRDYDIIAVVEASRNGVLECVQKNKFYLNDVVEVLEPGKQPMELKIETLLDENDNPIESAPHAQMKLKIICDRDFKSGSIIRKATAD